MEQKTPIKWYTIKDYEPIQISAWYFDALYQPKSTHWMVKSIQYDLCLLRVTNVYNLKGDKTKTLLLIEILEALVFLHQRWKVCIENFEYIAIIESNMETDICIPTQTLCLKQ